MSARGVRAVLLATAFAAAAGCAGKGPSLEATAPRADQVELGRAALERGDYTDARQLLKGYIDYDPTGARAAEAHYYLGMSHFRVKDWPMSVTEFSLVVNQFSQSPLAPDARYHLALSYWKQARGAPYDQDYTNRSIREFDRFLEVYPGHPQAEEIRRLRGEARDRLAKKDYENGRVYARQTVVQPAIFYFREVQRLYPESEWARWSALREAEVLMKVKRYPEARAVLDSLLAQTPLPGEVERSAQRYLREIADRDGRAAVP